MVFGQKHFLVLGGRMILVKIVDGVGYIKKGSIGRGFGAWGRAGRIKVTLGLSDFPKSVTPEEWERLTGIVKQVELNM